MSFCKRSLSICLVLFATHVEAQEDVLISSFEDGLDGWVVSGFNEKPVFLEDSDVGATDGDTSLAIIQEGDGFSWNAKLDVPGGSELYDAFNVAAGTPDNWAIAYDVTYDTDWIPASTTWLGVSFWINSDDGWRDVHNRPSNDGQQTVTINEAISLADPTLGSISTADDTFYQIGFGMNGDWGDGEAAVHIDNIRLTPVDNSSMPGTEVVLTFDDDEEGFVSNMADAAWSDYNGGSLAVTAAGGWSGAGAKLDIHSNPELWEQLQAALGDGGTISYDVFIEPDDVQANGNPGWFETVHVVNSGGTGGWDQAVIDHGIGAGDWPLTSTVTQTVTGEIQLGAPIQDRDFQFDPVDGWSELFLGLNNDEANVDAATVYFDNIRFRAHTVLVGDCSEDGQLTPDDLECVASLEQRDAVLAALNTLPGDLNGNGAVDFADFLVLSTHYSQPSGSYVEGNIDLANGIDFADFLALSANYGKVPGDVAAVPEPSCMTLLGIAGLGLLTRRRCSGACSL